MNPNPWQGRQAKKRARKPGNLQQLQAKLWRALCEAETVLETSEDAELTLKAVHAISQCAGQYAKLLEIGEFEARLVALEQKMAVA